MTEKTIPTVVKSILLGLGLLYVILTPHFIAVGRITYFEACLVVIIGTGQIWAAYTLNRFGEPS